LFADYRILALDLADTVIDPALADAVAGACPRKRCSKLLIALLLALRHTLAPGIDACRHGLLFARQRFIKGGQRSAWHAGNRQLAFEAAQWITVGDRLGARVNACGVA